MNNRLLGFSGYKKMYNNCSFDKLSEKIEIQNPTTSLTSKEGIDSIKAGTYYSDTKPGCLYNKDWEYVGKEKESSTKEQVQAVEGYIQESIDSLEKSVSQYGSVKEKEVLYYLANRITNSKIESLDFEGLSKIFPCFFDAEENNLIDKLAEIAKLLTGMLQEEKKYSLYALSSFVFSQIFPSIAREQRLVQKFFLKSWSSYQWINARLSKLNLIKFSQKLLLIANFILEKRKEIEKVWKGTASNKIVKDTAASNSKSECGTPEPRVSSSLTTVTRQENLVELSKSPNGNLEGLLPDIDISLLPDIEVLSGGKNSVSKSNEKIEESDEEIEESDVQEKKTQKLKTNANEQAESQDNLEKEKNPPKLLNLDENLQKLQSAVEELQKVLGPNSVNGKPLVKNDFLQEEKINEWIGLYKKTAFLKGTGEVFTSQVKTFSSAFDLQKKDLENINKTRKNNDGWIFSGALLDDDLNKFTAIRSSIEGFWSDENLKKVESLEETTPFVAALSQENSNDDIVTEYKGAREVIDQLFSMQREFIAIDLDILKYQAGRQDKQVTEIKKTLECYEKIVVNKADHRKIADIRKQVEPKPWSWGKRLAVAGFVGIASVGIAGIAYSVLNNK